MLSSRGLTALALSLVIAGCTDSIEQYKEMGFSVLSDGRGTSEPTVMRYDGPAAPVVSCTQPGFDDAAKVAAFLRVPENGDPSGTYILTNTDADGELEVAEIPVSGIVTLRNGSGCRPKT